MDCTSEGVAVPARVRTAAGRATHVCALALSACALLLASCSDLRPARATAVAQYDPINGRLKRIEFDASHTGRHNAIGVMDGTRLERIEVDEDHDGTVDRWEFYNANHRLDRVGFSRHHNGAIDAIAFYGNDGQVERIEVSTRGDGHFNRIEYYQGQSLERVDEDTNGDGRMDKWETYAADHRAASDSSPPIVSAAFDDSFRGTPNRRFIYRADGTVLRAEVDADGDGTFDAATGAQGQ